MSPLVRLLPLAAMSLLLSGQAPSPTPAKLSAVLGAFLPAAGAQTRGLPWNTGEALPVTWESPAPVAADAYEVQQGFALKRAGAIVVEVGAERLEASLQVLGNQAGIQQVMVAWRQLSGPFDAAATALAADGVTLTPLKCRRETEPATFGHVVHVAQFEGKLAVGLWENWNCGHDGCGYSLTILYRRAAVAAIECAGG